jgi:hypothetical protein
MDPAGMAEMRGFVRNLGRGRRIVFLSSHLMSDVEQICDRVGMISRGRLVGEGTVDELRGRESLWVRADPLEQAEALLATLRTVAEVARSDGGLGIAAETAPAPAINRALVEAGIQHRSRSMGGTDEPEQHPKPGRLARAVRPEEGVGLAPAHPRVEIVDGHDLVAVAHGQAVRLVGEAVAHRYLRLNGVIRKAR